MKYKMNIPVISSILSVLYPPTCAICGRVLVDDAEFLCADCLRTLPRVPYIPGQMTPTETLCAAIPRLQRARSWFRYIPTTEPTKLIIQIKYGGQQRLARYLGSTMAREMQPDGMFEGVDAIVPIPVSL